MDTDQIIATLALHGWLPTTGHATGEWCGLLSVDRTVFVWWWIRKDGERDCDGHLSHSDNIAIENYLPCIVPCFTDAMRKRVQEVYKYLHDFNLWT